MQHETFPIPSCQSGLAVEILDVGKADIWEVSAKPLSDRSDPDRRTFDSMPRIAMRRNAGSFGSRMKSPEFSSTSTRVVIIDSSCLIGATASSTVDTTKL